MSEKKEYIERGALIAFVRDVRKRLPKDSKDFFTRDEMLLNFQQYVDTQPAADVEPVVRCKDCINSRELYGNGLKSMYNEKWCEDQDRIVQENGFCECGAHMMERSGSGE